MKTLEAVGNNFYVAPVQKKLACRGSSNSETVCFKLNRYAGKTDLSECHCTIKTKNSEGQSDLAIPEVTADDKKLYINWTLSSGATAAAGKLLVQIQLEKIFDDSSQNINWQSNIMEFEIADSLDAANEIEDQDPTLFQQWEEKVNTLYSDVAAEVQAMQTLQTEVQTDANAVAQQKQSVEQTAAQVTQDAQNTSGSAQNAAASATAAQDSAAKAQTSASDAQTAQGYSEAAKTYSDTAEVSAQSAQTSVQNAQAQADTAQEAATQAQQKVDSFAGYTKEQIDNGFSNALIGEATGQTVTLDDIQPNTNLRSLLVTGQTIETGTGDKSPDNPYALSGATKITFGTETATHDYSLPQTLYSLPDGTADSCEAVGGAEMQRIRKATFDGSADEEWCAKDMYSDDTYESFALITADGLKNTKDNFYSDKFQYAGYWESKEGIYIGDGGTYSAIFIKIAKSRLSGWSDSWTYTQKTSALKTWLSSNPLAILYERAELLEIQTNPQAMKGIKCVSADRGTLTAKYICDSNTVLKKIKDSIILLGGTWPQ